MNAEYAIYSANAIKSRATIVLRSMDRIRYSYRMMSASIIAEVIATPCIYIRL